MHFVHCLVSKDNGIIKMNRKLCFGDRMDLYWSFVMLKNKV